METGKESFRSRIITFEGKGIIHNNVHINTERNYFKIGRVHLG